MSVSRKLQHWYELHKRDLPWRESTTPYNIWLSEIILQQTRVEQGRAYYGKFLEQYPKIEDMAAASLDEVLKLWQGLGYYTRARNMHATAKYIASELNGIFPGTYSGLLNLKGIGRYTAAAIASIAFREPVAVVDGNVLRVLSRFFGIVLPIDTRPGTEACHEKAMEILDIKKPHIHNQAVMELGALICLPKKPRCGECPLAGECFALKTGMASLIPVRSTKKLQRERYFNYLYIVHGDFTWLNKRTGRDIWHSLYEFPMIETAGPVVLTDLTATKDWGEIFGNSEVIPVGKARHYRHQLTHQIIHCSFYQIATSDEPLCSNRQSLKTGTGNLNRYAVPRIIEKYLADLNP